MPTSIEIREAVREDQEDVIRLWESMLSELSAYAPDIAASSDFAERVAADFGDRLRDPGCQISIAEASGDLVGFVQAELWQMPPIYRGRAEAFVSEIYVDPEFRGRGIGSMLFDSVSRWAKQGNCGAIRARVLAASKSSRGFWESVGADESTVDYVKVMDPVERRDEEKSRRIGF